MNELAGLPLKLVIGHVKIDGVDRQIMSKALEQAKVGRMHILSEMSKGISSAREEISEYAP